MVNSIPYNTCQKATTSFGIFAGIAEADLCLQEAISLYYAPYHLRFVCPQLIVDIPTPTHDLWNKSKDELSTDHVQHFPDIEHAYLQSLCDIQKPLAILGNCLDNFGRPDPGQHIHDVEMEHETSRLGSDELALTVNTMLTSMNAQQSVVFQTIYTTVTDPQRQNTVFYLDGKAGCGKSFLL